MYSFNYQDNARYFTMMWGCALAGLIPAGILMMAFSSPLAVSGTTETDRTVGMVFLVLGLVIVGSGILAAVAAHRCRNPAAIDSSKQEIIENTQDRVIGALDGEEIVLGPIVMGGFATRAAVGMPPLRVADRDRVFRSSEVDAMAVCFTPTRVLIAEAQVSVVREDARRDASAEFYHADVAAMTTSREGGVGVVTFVIAGGHEFSSPPVDLDSIQEQLAAARSLIRRHR